MGPFTSPLTGKPEIAEDEIARTVRGHDASSDRYHEKPGELQDVDLVLESFPNVDEKKVLRKVREGSASKYQNTPKNSLTSNPRRWTSV